MVFWYVMLIVRDLIRVLRFPLQEVSDWISLASARSGSIFGNGQVLVMRTVEDRADPICQLVSRQQPLGLYDLALAMDPLGLHRVEPRALFGQKAAYDPHSAAAVFDLTLVRGDPPSELFGDVPGSVVPDQNPYTLARRLKLLAAPRKEAGGYGAHGPPLHEAHPHLLESGHKQPVAGDGLRWPSGRDHPWRPIVR